jgi:hypothetical protein
MTTRATPIASSVVFARGKVEGDRFTRALVDLAAPGARTHCSGPGTAGFWLSENEAERAEAVKLCRSRLVIEPYGQAAEARGEKFGVGPALP